MNSKNLISRASFVLGLVLFAASAVVAQTPLHFTGLINDFSPSSVKNGPYVMSGHWTLDLHGKPADDILRRLSS